MAVEKDERTQALNDAFKTIEKQFGKGSVMRLGDKVHEKIEVISSGSISLDIALGVGGYPKGRIIEIYGPESSGKTTFALHAIAEAQKEGGLAAFIDAEHALDPRYARALGVDIDNLIVSQPDTGEQALEIAEHLIRSGAISILVVDSVAALVPKVEIDGDMGDSHIGIQARLMSQAMRKLAGVISKTNCIAIFINQIREKVGVMFGSPETTSGGRALKFYASVRLDIRRVEQIKNGTDIVGNLTRDPEISTTTSGISVCRMSIAVGRRFTNAEGGRETDFFNVTAWRGTADKVAPPFKVIDVDLIYGQGVSKEAEILDMAVNYDIINKSGSWFSYNDEKLGQGRENIKQFLKDNPNLREEILNKIKEKIGLLD